MYSSGVVAVLLTIGPLLLCCRPTVAAVRRSGARGACGSRGAPSPGRSRGARDTCRSAGPPCGPPGSAVRAGADPALASARSSSEPGRPSSSGARSGWRARRGSASMTSRRTPCCRSSASIIRRPRGECRSRCSPHQRANARRRRSPAPQPLEGALRRPRPRRRPAAGALQLPARPRPSTQEPNGDLHRRLRVRRLAAIVDAAARVAEPRQARPVRYSASLMPSTPTSMHATLPRISSSMLLGDLGVGLEEVARVLATLAEARVAVVEPGAGLRQDAGGDADVEQAALAADALVVHDVELGHPERARRPCS